MVDLEGEAQQDATEDAQCDACQTDAKRWTAVLGILVDWFFLLGNCNYGQPLNEIIISMHDTRTLCTMQRQTAA